MFFVYVIKSKTRNYIYIGLTQDVDLRVERHNSGRERTTRPYLPFELILVENYTTRSEARKREKQLKSGSGKEWLKREFGL